MSERAVDPQGLVLALLRQTGARQPKHTSHPLETEERTQGAGEGDRQRYRDRDREKERKVNMITQ